MAHSTEYGDDSRRDPVHGEAAIALCELFSEILEIPRVSPFMTFTELGGDSVRAIALTVRARASGLPIWTEDLLADCTPERLAALAARRSSLPSTEPMAGTAPPAADSGRPQTLSPLQPHMLDVAGTYGAETEAVMLYVDISGDLDVPRLQAAAKQLVQRHPNCHSGFRIASGDGRWVREVGTAVPLAWRYCDLGEQEIDEAALLRDELTSRFDLTRPPLFRIMLIKRGRARFRLVVTHSNILWDGWSTGILAAELAMLYDAPEQPTTAVDTGTDPYDDYLRWLSRQDRRSALHAWRKVLAGIERPTVLASAAPPESIGSTATIELALSESVGTDLEIRARSLGTTLSTAVQCAWGLTIAEIVGSDDIAFGYTTCGRPASVPAIDRAVGLLINDVPIRMRISDADTAASLLAQIRDQHCEMIRYEFLDSDSIQGAAGFVPLFDTLVVFQNLMRPDVYVRQDSGLRIDGYGIIESTHYALVLYGYPGDHLTFELSYHPNVFSRSFVDGLCERFRYYIEFIADDAERTIASLSSESSNSRRSHAQ
ncbi:condensation domain-containing protein [Nocardia sp. CC213A]